MGFSSIHFRRSVMSSSLRPHGLQHARPLCQSPTPGVYSKSCPLSRWYHPTISSFSLPLLLPPSTFPSIRVFSNNRFFTSGGQSIGVSASAPVLPMNVLDWFPLGWTGWISLQSKGLSRVFSTPQFESISLALSLLYGPTFYGNSPQNELLRYKFTKMYTLSLC